MRMILMNKPSLYLLIVVLFRSSASITFKKVQYHNNFYFTFFLNEFFTVNS